jgi:hypothetical protein
MSVKLSRKYFRKDAIRKDAIMKFNDGLYEYKSKGLSAFVSEDEIDAREKTRNEAWQMYLNWEIDEYELADMIGLQYDEIGAHIMAFGLWRKKNGTV